MKYQPQHSFTVKIWSRPKGYVNIFLWRTLTEMRRSLGNPCGEGRYEALTYQYQVEKGRLADMHLALTRCGPDVVAHEVYHVCAHLARVGDLCHEEDEEIIACLVDGLVAVIQGELAKA
jgi:hypothetical protein